VAADEAPDWYLKDWLRHFGKRQASLSNELGWTKGRAHYVWHGEHPYRREVVNEIARWLKIEPFELLMPPDRALALRRLRQHAAAIVAEEAAPFEHPHAEERKNS
jgi:hypothetical protein